MLQITIIEHKHLTWTIINSPAISKGGHGTINIYKNPKGIPYYWFNPVEGKFTADGKVTTDGVFEAPDQRPWVLIVGERTQSGEVAGR